MAAFLFIASVVLGLLSLATLGFVAVRAVRTKLRAAPNPTTEPPRVGEPFRYPFLARRIDDTTYELRHFTFGGADRIRVLTDSARRVLALDFQYADTTTFDQMVSDYAETLGRPTGIRSSGHRRRAYWENGRTRFELINWIVGDHRVMMSRLTDLLHRP